MIPRKSPSKSARPSEFKKEFVFALATARAAGRILFRGYGKGIGGIGISGRKAKHKGAIDLVTSTDLASEKLILSLIRRAFPGDDILAEESGRRTGKNKSGGKRCWVVDPLDGTTNFAHGYPAFCVSIALMVIGEPAVGVVYDPLRDELFSARRGVGAYLNGRRLRVSATHDIAQALCATGFAYDTHTSKNDNLANHRRVIKRSQGVRRGGSAALDLCYVACGRFDAFWEMKLSPWDTAAGALIAREAGATVSAFRNQEFSIFGKEIIAANSRLHQVITTLVK